MDRENINQHRLTALKNNLEILGMTQQKFISHLSYSPILFGRGNIYRGVNELHTMLQGPRLFLSDNAAIFYTCSLRSSREEKRVGFYVRAKMWCTSLLPTFHSPQLSHSAPSTLAAKETGKCSCQRKQTGLLNPYYLSR